MRRYLILLLMAALLAGCGSSSTTDVDTNETPTISFNTNVLAVQKGFPVDLAVAIDDPDGDPLSVTWAVSAEGGSLDPNDQGNPVMTWTPPAAIGSYTITATVTDGKASASASIVLQTGTVVANDVQGGTTSWSSSNSPYIIKQLPGDLNFIISGGTLVIGPGVTVLIETELQEINVYGTLDIRGMQNLPVVIKPNRRHPNPGFWKGILADISASIKCRYARISYAEFNIRTDTEAKADIRESSLAHGEKAGFHSRSKASLIIEHCDLSDNEGKGLEVIVTSDYPDSIVITNSNIMFNRKSGIEIQLPNPIVAGIPTYIEFTQDSIAFNEINGINLLMNAYPVIHNCWIFFNDIIRANNGFNVRIDPGFQGPLGTIDARYNYWGFNPADTDSTAIASGTAGLIYDNNDTSIPLPEVIFIPWCDNPPCLVMP